MCVGDDTLHTQGCCSHSGKIRYHQKTTEMMFAFCIALSSEMSMTKWVPIVLVCHNVFTTYSQRIHNVFNYPDPHI